MILSRFIVHSIGLFEAFRVLSCSSPSFRTAYFFSLSVIAGVEEEIMLQQAA